MDKLYTVEYDGKYWWIVFEEGVWENAEFMDYLAGYPIYVKNTY